MKIYDRSIRKITAWLNQVTFFKLLIDQKWSVVMKMLPRKSAVLTNIAYYEVDNKDWLLYP